MTRGDRVLSVACYCGALALPIVGLFSAPDAGLRIICAAVVLAVGALLIEAITD